MHLKGRFIDILFDRLEFLPHCRPDVIRNYTYEPEKEYRQQEELDEDPDKLQDVGVLNQ